MITLQLSKPFGYLVVNDDGRDILFQQSMDYPSLASNFGWPYQDFDKDISEQIQEAIEWLDDHIGDTAEDPGYFWNEEDFMAK